MVVDDLPHAAGPDARRRLARALGELAATARFPVVVVTSESGGSGAGGDRGGGGGGGGSVLQGGLAKVCAPQHIALANLAVRISRYWVTVAFHSELDQHAIHA